MKWRNKKETKLCDEIAKMFQQYYGIVGTVESKKLVGDRWILTDKYTLFVCTTTSSARFPGLVFRCNKWWSQRCPGKGLRRSKTRDLNLSCTIKVVWGLNVLENQTKFPAKCEMIRITVLGKIDSGNVNDMRHTPVAEIKNSGSGVYGTFM